MRVESAWARKDSAAMPALSRIESHASPCSWHRRLALLVPEPPGAVLTQARSARSWAQIVGNARVTEGLVIMWHGSYSIIAQMGVLDSQRPAPERRGPRTASGEGKLELEGDANLGAHPPAAGSLHRAGCEDGWAGWRQALRSSSHHSSSFRPAKAGRVALAGVERSTMALGQAWEVHPEIADSRHYCSRTESPNISAAVSRTALVIESPASIRATSSRRSAASSRRMRVMVRRF